MLENHPDDMEVLNGCYSDYCVIDQSEWSVVEGVAKNGWVMRSHPTMGEENKMRVKKYLYLDGN